MKANEKIGQNILSRNNVICVLVLDILVYFDLFVLSMMSHAMRLGCILLHVYMYLNTLTIDTQQNNESDLNRLIAQHIRIVALLRYVCVALISY